MSGNDSSENGLDADGLDESVASAESADPAGASAAKARDSSKDVPQETDSRSQADSDADKTPDDKKSARQTKPAPRQRSVRSEWTSPREMVASVLARPLASFHLIVTLGVLLTVFGLVMVLSASSVEGYAKDGSAYGMFTNQVIFTLAGIVLFWFAIRLPIRMMRRLAAPSVAVTTLMLAAVLVPGIGTYSQGARRWFSVAGLSLQPSELVKVALCVWAAHLLASRRRENASLKELLIPLVPVAVLICALIILEPNLSTTITIGIIVAAALWFAGLPIKVFVSFVISGAILAVVLSLVEGYRSQRVMSFLGQTHDPQGAGYQAKQARYALANGGFFGVGLGQSRAKWNYLPNAHNDFIFAIIGEELGLIGALTVVLLFGLLAYVGFRIALRSVDPFLRLLTGTITVIITAQALINIGYVIGLLPVTGIQLPLLSAGGTSTLTTMTMFGILANAARHEPEAVAALAAGGDGRFGRLLRLPRAVPYSPSRSDSLRDRLDRRRTRGSRPAPKRMAEPRRRGEPADRGRGQAPLPRQRTPSTPWRGESRQSREKAARVHGRSHRGSAQSQGGARRGKAAQPYRPTASSQRRTSQGDPTDRRRSHSRWDDDGMRHQGMGWAP
ncbi:putative lipid II flippase FtsW [Jongsikchunia kroppenstedtii]|uniref:putative lipid II flippase FtsW n=1 Tax=Jongsikchunia kroppenstedtii TaxID=1121721 RepID=UPI000382F103|nr:putative lipid II flippase FtsW [Jongsikchunia kroppenstedtii]